MTSEWLALGPAFRRDPKRAALIAGARAWTYAELERKTHEVAARLAAWGAGTGSVVAALMPNSAAYALLVHAVHQLGAALLPLNTRLTADELRYQLNAAHPTLLIDAPETGALSKNIFADAYVHVGETAAFRSVHYTPAPVDENAVATIIFTSGTTGHPKGAQLTYGSIIASAQASAERIGVRADDRWLLTLPLYHIGGLSILYRGLLDGTGVVLYDGGFDPARLSAALHEHRITLLSLVPTQLYRMLEANASFPLSLRLILLGGAAAAPDLLRRAQALGLPIAPTYGLTEAASQVATMLPQDAYHKPGSVGKAVQGTSFRILDDAGSDLPPNAIGEIVVSGNTIMRGYLGQQAIPRGSAFHTGDLGYLDAEGDLWLVQRRSDLIISGGENIYPAEVEAVLKQHPAVADACVVAVPDAEWGQRPAAAVVLKANAHTDANALSDHCQAHLAGYKRPRRYLFVEALPQTPSGKVIRRDVAAWFIDEPS